MVFFSKHPETCLAQVVPVLVVSNDELPPIIPPETRHISQHFDLQVFFFELSQELQVGDQRLMGEQFNHDISGTYVCIMVTALASSLFDLTPNNCLLQRIRDSGPGRGLPSALRLVAGSLLRQKCFNEDAVVLCRPAAPWTSLGRHSDGCLSESELICVSGFGVMTYNYWI